MAPAATSSAILVLAYKAVWWPLHRAGAPIPVSLVGSSQLCVVSVRLLEVIGEDLLVVGPVLPRRCLQPESEAFMEIGSELFRHRVVGGVPNQHMNETEPIVAHEQ